MIKDEWQVFIIGQARKAKKNLSKKALDSFILLIFQLKSSPIQVSWANYSQLKGKKDHHHCHVEKGRPTYVAC